jgi:MoaA/NifB/PqqE/SkfB family radical SAM enzyme
VILDRHEKKRRLLLRLKSIESGRALIGPATVHLRLTDLCNLACSYCWYYSPGSALHPTGTNHLPYEVFEGIARDCEDLQVDTINLSGIGDPIFHPRFYDILRRLEPSFEVTIFSNGTFPVERCRDILRASRIIINLGAADREGYRALQGRDLFVKVIKNIRELARLRPQFNPYFSIEVVIIVTSLNERDVLRTENLVRKLGANLVQKKEFQPSAHNQHMILPGHEEKEEMTGEWPPCYHGWFYSAVKLNGDVNVCCYSQSLTIGNVFKTPFKQIWGSDEYTRARALAHQGGEPFRSDHDCINCHAAWRNKKIAEEMEMYNRILKA